MFGVAFHDSIGLGTVVTVIAATLVALPATILAWNSLQAKMAEKAKQEKAEETNRIAKAVAKILAGSDSSIPPRSPENPSIVDLATEINRKLDILLDGTTAPDSSNGER